MQDYDLKDFKSYLMFERGLSENTVDGYMRDLRAFMIILIMISKSLIWLI